MASLKISILDSFLSGGRVGRSLLSDAKAALKASTLIRSLVAWAVLYLSVARLRLLRSSRDSPAQGDPAPLDKYASSERAHGSSTRSLQYNKYSI